MIPTKLALRCFSRALVSFSPVSNAVLVQAVDGEVELLNGVDDVAVDISIQALQAVVHRPSVSRAPGSAVAAPLTSMVSPASCMDRMSCRVRRTRDSIIVSSRPEPDSPLLNRLERYLQVGYWPSPRIPCVVSPRDEHELVIQVPHRVVDGRGRHEHHSSIRLTAPDDIHQGAVAFRPWVAEVVGLVYQDDVVLVLVALQLGPEPLPFERAIAPPQCLRGWAATPW